MKVTIKQLDELRLVGIPVYGSPDTEIFTKAWKIFKSIEKNYSWKDNNCFYGIEFYTAELQTDEEWFYLASKEVENFSSIPNPFVAKILPASKYAVVTCKGGISTIGNAYNYLYEQWLPNSDYVSNGRYDFEYYDERFKGINNIETEIDIYIPIKKKQ